MTTPLKENSIEQVKDTTEGHGFVLRGCDTPYQSTCFLSPPPPPPPEVVNL